MEQAGTELFAGGFRALLCGGAGARIPPVTQIGRRSIASMTPTCATLRPQGSGAYESELPRVHACGVADCRHSGRFATVRKSRPVRRYAIPRQLTLRSSY